MSRRNQKKEDEGSAGKVLTGLAVGAVAAVAGAALGYFGYKAWQANQEPEVSAVRNSSKPAASSSSCAKYMEDEKDDFRAGSEPFCQSAGTNRDRSSVTSQRNMPRAKPSAVTSGLSIHDEVLEYYKNYVQIHPQEMRKVQRVVDEIRSTVSDLLRDMKIHGLPFLRVGDILPFGSVTEELKVIHPDQFDVMIPVMLESTCTIRQYRISGEPSAEFVYITVNAGSGDGAKCDVLLDSENRLIVENLVDSLLDAFQQTCIKLHHIASVSVEKSMITMTIYNADSMPWFTINFIPAVIVDGKLYLPRFKPVGKVNSARLHDDDDDDELVVQWCMSYARQEQWSIDRFDASVQGHRIALKVLKAIALNNSDQFGCLSSYHLKTLALHVLDDLPDSSDWSEATLVERLIDLLARLAQALNEHKLPHYFNSSSNLLSSVSPAECSALAKFIEKKLGHNDISSLLKTDY